jgi:rubrerythrin
MSAAPASRREALRRAALGAGAIAAAGLLRPGAALAQSTEDEDLRDFMVEAIGLEQVAVLAYAEAADAQGVSAPLRQTLELFRDQEQAHANALRSAIDSLGFDAPDAPDSTTDTEVFDEVDGLSDESAERLTGLLERLDGLRDRDELLEFLAGIETDQLDLYLGSGPDLDSEDLSVTCAEIAGCQAQHLVALRLELGDDPATALDEAAGAIAAVPTE